MVQQIPSYALQLGLTLDTDDGEYLQIDGDLSMDADEFADVLTDVAAEHVLHYIEEGDVAFGEEVIVEFGIEATNVLIPTDDVDVSTEEYDASMI